MELKEFGIKKVYTTEIDYTINNEDDSVFNDVTLHYKIMFDLFLSFKEYYSDDIEILSMNDLRPDKLIERCELTYEDIENIKDDIADDLNMLFNSNEMPYKSECYENNGMVCPYCKSSNVNSYKEIPGLWEIHDIMSCGVCEKEFTYVYELTNIIKED